MTLLLSLICLIMSIVSMGYGKSDAVVVAYILAAVALGFAYTLENKFNNLIKYAQNKGGYGNV